MCSSPFSLKYCDRTSNIWAFRFWLHTEIGEDFEQGFMSARGVINVVMNRHCVCIFSTIIV